MKIGGWGGEPRVVLSQGEGGRQAKNFKLLNNSPSHLYSAIYRSSSEQQQCGCEGGRGKRGYVLVLSGEQEREGALCSKKQWSERSVCNCKDWG